MVALPCPANPSETSIRVDLIWTLGAFWAMASCLQSFYGLARPEGAVASRLLLFFI